MEGDGDGAAGFIDPLPYLRVLVHGETGSEDDGDGDDEAWMDGGGGLVLFALEGGFWKGLRMGWDVFSGCQVMDG